MTALCPRESHEHHCLRTHLPSPRRYLPLSLPLYHFISCGLSPLRRLNVLPRYSMRCGSFLMVVNSALSTAFWSLARAEVTFFFYTTTSLALIDNIELQTANQQRFTNLGFLALLEELLLPLLLCGLIPGEVSFLRDLLDHLIVYPLQLHLRARSNDVSRIDSS